MEHTLLVLALTTAGAIALPTTSHAADAGFFVNGALGHSKFKKSIFNDSDTGYYGNIGYRWAVAPSALIGVEGGYADLGEFLTYKVSSFGSNAFVGAGAKMKGWTLGANGRFNIAPQWYVSARGGWAQAEIATWATGGGTANGWYAGAGAGYDFANNMSVGLNYDHFAAEKIGFKGIANMLSAGAEVRF